MSIHSASAQDRFLRRTFCFSLVVALLLVTAHRLPAPISEIPENPTPAQEQSAKPKPKRTIKPKVTNENSEDSGKQQTRTTVSTTKRETTPSNPFEGTWRGTLDNLPFAGNVDFTLVITAAGTAVVEKSANWGTKNFQSNCDGSTMKWETGSSWTLTPNPDKQTALVTCNSAGFFGIGAFSLSTIFRRTLATTSAQAPSLGSTSVSQTTMPIAKPVPNRPGFVYNPFDSKSNSLLDVRGKASGTKVKDPTSGKLFVVP
jgi:hypothetical protein